jgi:hypothetical protein
MVSKAAIDAKGKTAKGDNCKIEGLEVTQDGLKFERLDKALPLPIDKRAQSALALAPVLNDLSRHELQISGLPAGTYSVAIDGEEVGQVESVEKGWNLSNLPGPVTAQGAELLDLIFKKNDVFFRRWRSVQLFGLPDWAKGADIETQRSAEVKRLDAEVAKFEEQINSIRKPKTHRFELKRQ